MQLRHDILARIESTEPEQLLARMGYTQVQPDNISRLDAVLAAPWLGLAGGGYDFVHDSRTFLLALCEALGMDREASTLRINDIDAYLRAREVAYRPWLQVQSIEAEQASSGKNWLGRWAVNAGRKLPLGEESHGQPLERIIELAREAILRHAGDTGGRTDSGHRIDSYLLFHREDKSSLRMNLKGEVTGTGPVPRQ